ncbi:MAG: hypothetical protein ACYC25_03780 [Paludibacter sp.]
MAKMLKYIFLILSATYFLFAGTGYNVMKYSCKACHIKAFESTEPESVLFLPKIQSKSKSCCHQQEPVQEKITCQTVNEHSKKCFFMRVTVDTPLINPLDGFKNISAKCIDLLYSSMLVLKSNQQLDFRTNYPPPNDLLSLSGRDILARKRVLVI